MVVLLLQWGITANYRKHYNYGKHAIIMAYCEIMANKWLHFLKYCKLDLLVDFNPFIESFTNPSATLAYMFVQKSL